MNKAKATHGASALAYSVGFIGALAVDGQVSDFTLAGHLQHGTRDAATTLLTWRSPEGETFELRLCGQVRVRLTADSDEVRSVDGNTRAYKAASGALSTAYEVIESPFFEWLDEKGDPVGDVFDSISANAEDEVAELVSMLEYDCA